VRIVIVLRNIASTLNAIATDVRHLLVFVNIQGHCIGGD